MRPSWWRDLSLQHKSCLCAETAHKRWLTTQGLGMKGLLSVITLSTETKYLWAQIALSYSEAHWGPACNQGLGLDQLSAPDLMPSPPPLFPHHKAFKGIVQHLGMNHCKSDDINLQKGKKEDLSRLSSSSWKLSTNYSLNHLHCKYTALSLISNRKWL